MKSAAKSERPSARPSLRAVELCEDREKVPLAVVMPLVWMLKEMYFG
jgi:hypothetical protein